ncbi:MAG: M20/M25/M40 family metallo-hydrolase [Clostridia bacterium]
MFNDMIKDILAAYGPSGREQTVSDVIRGYVAPFVDEVYSDALGNLIAHKKGTSGKKLMLSAHMDQIGLIVTDIDENGFLRAMNVGGVGTTISIARNVIFQNGTHGVTYFETEKKNITNATLSEVFIDIGAADREEAQSRVCIGDVAVYRTPVLEMGKRMVSGAMDNRICCAIIAQALSKISSPHDIYAVFTVQEEVGCRGAGAAAYAIEPDLNINLDVTLTGDTPKAARMSVALGKGPAIKVMDSSLIVPLCVRNFMERVAKAHDITVQNEVLQAGGTDTSAIQRSRGGVLAGCISIPTRYVHSPVETVDLGDVNAAVSLLRALVAESELPQA